MHAAGVSVLGTVGRSVPAVGADSDGDPKAIRPGRRRLGAGRWGAGDPLTGAAAVRSAGGGIGHL